MTSTDLDLATMFKAATRTLKQNQTSLNLADDYNHNHGDNMVETFKLITKAVGSKKEAAPSDQLAYASQVLRQKANSGSAIAYSDGLERAAQQFRGKQVTPESAVELISALMGGGQTQNSSPAGSLLGSLMGGSSAPSQGGSAGDLLGSLLGGSSASSQQGSAGGDMLGTLLGGLTGGSSSQQSQQSSSGIDTGDLINIGMQLFQAYQASSGKPSSGSKPSSGGGLVGGLLDSLLSNSSMGSSSHRSESGKIVVDALLKIASQYLNKRK